MKKKNKVVKKVTTKQVRERQEKRTKRSKSMDSKKTAKKIYGVSEYRKWIKRPGSGDIRGVDTKTSVVKKKKIGKKVSSVTKKSKKEEKKTRIKIMKEIVKNGKLVSAKGTKEIYVKEIDFVPLSTKVKKEFSVKGEVVKVKPTDITFQYNKDYRIKMPDGISKSARKVKILGYYPERDVLVLDVIEWSPYSRNIWS